MHKLIQKDITLSVKYGKHGTPNVVKGYRKDIN